MNVIEPPRDTLYEYLRGRACAMMIMTVILQPNQTLTTDFPGWKSDAAYDSLRISAMLAGRTVSAASIDVHFEKPLSEINFNAHAGAAAFKGAMLAFDKPSNVLRLSVASVQSLQLDLYGPDGRKIAAIFSREQCVPGVYRFSLNKFTGAKGFMIVKLKAATAVSVVPITIVR
jgi:hypothetical protein